MKYLLKAKNTALKYNISSYLTMAFFISIIFCIFAYAFYIGSIWLQYDFYNSIFARSYTMGDIVAGFYGVLFGLRSFDKAINNIKYMREGKVAGKLVFDIIDRVPQINQYDPNASEFDSI
jgi:hypothetical protein